MHSLVVEPFFQSGSVIRIMAFDVCDTMGAPC